MAASYDNPGIYDDPNLTFDGEVVSGQDDMPQYLKAAWARVSQFAGRWRW